MQRLSEHLLLLLLLIILHFQLKQNCLITLCRLILKIQNMMLNNWTHNFPIYWDTIKNDKKYRTKTKNLFQKSLTVSQKLYNLQFLFFFYCKASWSDSNKWTHFQKCIQFGIPLAPPGCWWISKYYNHYQIGEFPLLVFAQCYHKKCIDCNFLSNRTASRKK